MQHARFWFVVVLGLAILSPLALAADNAGFVQGNIWYAPDPFFAGQTVRVYSGVFNGTSNDIIGTVEFYDNGKAIGTDDFTISHGGNLREVWVDWQAPAGDHTVSAKIIRAAISKAGQPATAIQMTSSESGQNVRFIDSDTDGDGIGNRLDPDDDNDGISDEEEAAQGTNPLVKTVKAKSEPAPSEAAATAARVEESVTEVAGKVTDVAKNAAASAADSFDAAADSLRGPLLEKKAELEREIAELEHKENTYAQTETGKSITEALEGSEQVGATRPTGTPGETVLRIAKQLYLFCIILTLYILDHKFILYILLAAVLYKMIRIVIRRVIARGI